MPPVLGLPDVLVCPGLYGFRAFCPVSGNASNEKSSEHAHKGYEHAQ